MASPQTEKGHIRLSNELLEQILLFPFSKRELQIVLAVIRKTYGFNKKRDAIAMYQLSTMTGIPRSHVAGTIKNLVGMNVLTVSKSDTVIRGQSINEIGINKDYEQWATVSKTGTVTVPKPVTVPKSGTVPELEHDRTQTGTPTVPETVTTKDNTKDKQKTVGRGSRFSAENVPHEWVAWTELNHPRINPYEIFQEFRDYWISIPGAKGIKLDWFATWRNWIRKEAKNGNKRHTGRSDAFYTQLRNHAATGH